MNELLNKLQASVESRYRNMSHEMLEQHRLRTSDPFLSRVIESEQAYRSEGCHN